MLTKKLIGKAVFISQSTNVFTNLAFEDWVYRYLTLQSRHILLLWRNSPCVVIGRHQNPCVEANLEYLESARIPIARRNSGGGTVYHDEGNLNCTFFTPREQYNRKWNLGVICKSLLEDFGILTTINKRDDIMSGPKKISGTAAKLGQHSAYHHCTVLVACDISQLHLALQGEKNIETKATKSILSPVGNLVEDCKDITVEKLMASIGQHYMKTPITGRTREMAHSHYSGNGYTLINPTDDWFPGLASLESELSSWSGLHRLTPYFVVRRVIKLPEGLTANTNIEVAVHVYHGRVKSLEVISKGISSKVIGLIQGNISRGMEGTPYTKDVFSEITNRMRLPDCLNSQRYCA